MRFSTVTFQVLGGAAALASAAAVSNKRAADSILVGLPLADFPLMDTVSFEEAEEQLANQNATEPSPTDGANDGMSFTDAVLPGGPCKNPSIRVEWRNMKNADRHGFLNGVKCLMDKAPSGKFPAAKNRYEDIVSGKHFS